MQERGGLRERRERSSQKKGLYPSGFQKLSTQKAVDLTEYF